jgi:hypothetical protein
LLIPQNDAGPERPDIQHCCDRGSAGLAFPSWLRTRIPAGRRPSAENLNILNFM